MSWLYSLVSYIVFGLGLPLWWLKRRLRGGWARRLGCYGALARPGPWPAGAGPRIWFHAASAGDVRAIAPIVRRVRDALPQATIVLSVITDSGATTAERALAATVDGVTYAPVDLPCVTRRAMRVLRPDVLVLEYAELWPNLLLAARSAGATTVLANGRLHPRRLAAYRWLAWLFGSPLAILDRLLMRSPDDAERARQLGAHASRIEVTGNSKFDDLEPPPAEEAAGVAAALGPGRWLVAGSTHKEDESGVFEAFTAVRVADAQAKLLIVPRHPERAEAVAAAARRWRWRVRLSALDDSDAGEAAPGDTTDVVVVSSVGRLRAAYGAARLAIVGGGFGDRGGHNILEPASVGVPVIAGPDLANFVDAVELLRGRGLIQVPDIRSLVRVTVDLWTNDGLRATLGHRAVEAVRSAQGAADRDAAVIVELAGTRALRSAPALLGPGPAG